MDMIMGEILNEPHVNLHRSDLKGKEVISQTLEEKKRTWERIWRKEAKKRT